MLTGENGILKRAAETQEKSIDAQNEEEENLQEMLNQINSIIPSTDGYLDNKKVNSPKLSRGMIPIKWDENQSAWVVCDVNDNWYNYDKMNKHKGIGINEISKIFSFFAPSSIDGNWNWFKDVNGALNGSSEYISSWDNDYLFLGYMDRVFIHIGGDGGDGISTGIMAFVTGWRGPC